MAISQINSNSLASGVPASSNMPTGTVLQVVQGTLTGRVSTSSTSFVTTGLSASITPRSASSKILVTVATTAFFSTSSTQPNLTIYRNGSNIGNSGGFTNSYSNSGALVAPMNISYLDSPATTSALTYTLYYANAASNSASIYLNQGGIADNQIATIILTEIAG